MEEGETIVLRVGAPLVQLVDMRCEACGWSKRGAEAEGKEVALRFGPVTAPRVPAEYAEYCLRKWGVPCPACGDNPMLVALEPAGEVTEKLKAWWLLMGWAK